MALLLAAGMFALGLIIYLIYDLLRPSGFGRKR